MPPDDDVYSMGETDPIVSPRQREEGDRATSTHRIVSVTRFTDQKRTHILIAALARLRERGIVFKCRLIGTGGKLLPSIERQIDDAGLADHVVVVGALSSEEVASEYRGADLTVLASVNEGFGMTLLEAQLCGCSVVGVRSGGLTDFIEDGVTGFLARPDDVDDLASVIASVLADRDGRLRTAEQGMHSARRNFSSSVIADRFVGWYRELCQ